MMDNEIIVEENLTFESIPDDKMVEYYNEADAFLKLVEEEIKRTDTGDQDE